MTFTDGTGREPPSGGDTEQATPKVRAIARAVLEACKYDREAAVERLTDRIFSEPDLARPYIEAAARSLIMQAGHNQRASLKRGCVAAKADDARGLSIIGQRWLDSYTLPNGSRLGDAKAEDLTHAAKHHAEQESGNRRSRRFIESIRAKVTGSKRVRDVLAEREIDVIWSKLSR